MYSVGYGKRETLEIGRREMVVVEKSLDGLLKPLGFVETLRERKIVCRQEKKILLMEFSRDNKENLLTMVVE